MQNAKRGLANAFYLDVPSEDVLDLIRLDRDGERKWARKQYSINEGLRPVDQDIDPRRSLAKYQLKASWLKTELRNLAAEWIKSGRSIDKANDVRMTVEAFLKEYPPRMLTAIADRQVRPVLVFPGKRLQDPHREARHQLSLMLAYIVLSKWANSFYRCPICGEFFVKVRTTANEPRCSRKCNDVAKKRRVRGGDLDMQLEAAAVAVRALRRLPASKNSRKAIADEANKVLPPKLRIGPKFISRHEGEKLPDLSTGRQRSQQ